MMTVKRNSDRYLEKEGGQFSILIILSEFASGNWKINIASTSGGRALLGGRIHFCWLDILLPTHLSVDSSEAFVATANGGVSSRSEKAVGYSGIAGQT
jgi:hypothetical protein